MNRQREGEDRRIFPEGLETYSSAGWIKYRWRVYIRGTYHLEETRPNWFRRFWYWALLGWVWEPLETGPDRPMKKMEKHFIFGG